MNAIADRYKEQGVGSIFLYTHEAHPGEHYPHLISMEQKFSNARDLESILGVTRLILVDTLEGDCHRAYGSMPNMSWIFTRAGVPVYKSDWTDPPSIANALDYLLDSVRRRQDGEHLAPFRVERLDFRTQDREAFNEGLERNGPKAIEEFQQAFGKSS